MCYLAAKNEDEADDDAKFLTEEDKVDSNFGHFGIKVDWVDA